MSTFDPILMEIDQEAATTRRVLERVPEEQLTWKPHEKSMSLGQLALHIATTPGMIAGMLAGESYEIDPANIGKSPAATSRQEILDQLDTSVKQAKEFVSSLAPERAAATWSLTAGGRSLLAAPRGAMMRSIMLNHWYHHRGQLTVYLRLLNVKVPSVYGPSADEAPPSMTSQTA
jgi:uncharacterized damage-inducible protein DinB